MDISFACYRFSPEQGLLYRDNELVPLKTKQAALLNLFLTDVKAVHSKDQIMNQVWADQVVSEQVVFQTISQLRAIFGNQAIRTFSKKGYQWQLPITDTTEPTVAQPELQVSVAGLPNKPAFTRYGLWAVTFAMLTVFTYLGFASSDKQPIVLHYSASDGASAGSEFSQLLRHTSVQSANVKLQPANLAISSQQAFSTPNRSWTLSELPPQDWLVWGDVYAAEKGVYLHLGLANANFDWQSYVFAESVNELGKQLAVRLADLQQMGLFSSKGKPDIMKLRQMHAQHPEDIDLLLLLAKHYTDIEHMDVALTYLQKARELSASSDNLANQALAELHRGRIYKMRNQHLQSYNSLLSMQQILNSTSIWPLRLDNIRTHAWLAYAHRDFSKMFKVLDQGLTLADEMADPLMQFEMHILYSILADKADRQEARFRHLNAAQSLLLDHKLDDSNLAIVYFHFALFSDDNKQAEPYLEKILALPRSRHNFWVQDSALDMLVQYQIDRQAFTSAQALLAELPARPKNLILSAKIQLAKQQTEAAALALQKAFSQARLAYDSKTGIDAAMLLYQMSDNEPKRQAEYLAYLQTHADADWLSQQSALAVRDVVSEQTQTSR